MSKFSVFFITLSFTLSTWAWSRETHLEIQNLSKSKIITTVITEVDSFDFEKGHGIMEKFQNVTIPPGKSEERQIEVNGLASNCPFTMTLWFEDLTSEWFRINQKHAIREAKPNFSKSSRNKEISFKRSGITIVITVKDKVDEDE